MAAEYGNVQDQTVRLWDIQETMEPNRPCVMIWK